MTDEMKIELAKEFAKGVTKINQFILEYSGTTIIKDSKEDESEKRDYKKFSKEDLADIVLDMQIHFWGNSSYAVVFCICRDDYKECLTRSDFEEMIEQLPYRRKRSYSCPVGTIANAFSNNPIFNEPISEWDKFNPLARIMKLRDELRKELKL